MKQIREVRLGRDSDPRLGYHVGQWFSDFKDSDSASLGAAQDSASEFPQ